MGTKSPDAPATTCQTGRSGCAGHWSMWIEPMVMREMDSRGITKYWRVRSESLTSAGISSEDWNKHIAHSVSILSYFIAFPAFHIMSTFQTTLLTNLHCRGILDSFSLAHMSFVIVVPGASSDEGLKLLDLSQLSRHLLGREDSPPFRPPGAQQSQSKHRWQLHTILRSHSFLSSGMQERRDPPNHARKAATDAILRSEVRTQIFR